MAKKERYLESNCRPLLRGTGELEGLGCSGDVDPQITAYENSSIPTRIIQLSKLSSTERKSMVLRLRAELKQVRAFQNSVESFRVQGGNVSSSNDILGCSVSQSQPPMLPPKTHKRKPPKQKGRALKRGTSGKFESAKQESGSATSHVMVMKQCDTLLKRLMSHQFSSMFNEPVDVVKHNIPDYFTIIKHPMDLGTIKRKLSSGVYKGPHDFVADVRLVFSNAMTYNPQGHDVHTMARTLSRFFEVRWKPIEKKLGSIDTEIIPSKSGSHEEVKAPGVASPSKKRILSDMPPVVVPERLQKIMTAEEKRKMTRELESYVGELPKKIIEFLREHCSSGADTEEDEIEIDIDALSDDTLYRLRKLLDEDLEERHRTEVKPTEPCEIELLHGSGHSNSSLQACKEYEHVDEDVDIEGNSSPEVNKTLGKKRESLESETGEIKASLHTSKVDPGTGFHDALVDKRTSITGTEEDERENASSDGQISSEKLYRAALLKNRFADTILKAREKTLNQVEKGDPQKLRLEREELERQRKKEKARLQAEARAAEDAQRKAAALESKHKRELERAAARQALVEMEKTVDITDNSHILKDLEMLRSAPGEQLPSSVDETSPNPSQQGLCDFTFGGSKALEQLGLFMKEDEEEEVDILTSADQSE